jgi:hypothetical protein
MKTSNLTGAALDWAVAKCEGVALLDPHDNKWELCWTLLGDNSGDYYAPSTNWAQGGPIIEREHIQPSYQAAGKFVGQWSCNRWVTNTQGATVAISKYGETLLIAAMRCYVASKLGDEVELPPNL